METFCFDVFSKNHVAERHMVAAAATAATIVDERNTRISKYIKPINKICFGKLVARKINNSE